MPSAHSIITEMARYTRDSGYTAMMTEDHVTVFETTDDSMVWTTHDPATMQEVKDTVQEYMSDGPVDEQTALDAWAKQVVDCL